MAVESTDGREPQSIMTAYGPSPLEGLYEVYDQLQRIREFNAAVALDYIIPFRLISARVAASPIKNSNGKPITTDRIFRGPRRSIAIDVDGQRFNVESPSLQTVKPGEHVTVAALAGQAWAFRSAP